MAVLALRIAICWGSTSIGDMCPHLPFEPVDGADAEAYFPCHFANADAFGEFLPGLLNLVGLGPRPAEPPPHLASLGDELAIALDLPLDDAQAGPDPLADH